MNIKNYIQWSVVLLLLSHSLSTAQAVEDTINIYLVKENWHTGLMIPVNEFTIEHIPIIKNFNTYQFVDIGWGDEDFYQAPDFDLYLAAKAILVPSPSVIRIDGYIFPIERIIQWRDFAVQFKMTKEMFLNMAAFINSSFEYDSDNNVIGLNTESSNSTIFYKSIHKYHLLRTCNTWAAESFKAAGFDVDTFGLITAEQLFSKLGRHGMILKEIK